MKLSIPKIIITDVEIFFRKYKFRGLLLLLITISVSYFFIFLINGLGLAYNDARTHLDIGRRVIEGLKPGIAQLGSVWLPLNHILMVPTIWNDFMWHSGLAGAIQNMISFVGTGILIYLYLKQLNVGLLGRLLGVLVFVANLNILYLQSTAMTELLLLFTMTAGCYELLLWHKNNNMLNLIRSAFWIMLSTLTRYDGWFLLFFAIGLVVTKTFRRGYKVTEGTTLLFLTLAGFGIALWLLWNQLIFNDAFYFAFGLFSAHTQQDQLFREGGLLTKGNLLLSLKVYLYALLYSSYTIPAFLALIGGVVIWTDKKLTSSIRMATMALTTPFFFNVLALFLGFSVLVVQGISGDKWFNIRYGMMLMPTIAIFIGYLIDRAKNFRLLIIGLLAFVLFFAFANNDAVTIDDARVGSSQKNVSEVSAYLKNQAGPEKGFILISAASHDAVIFSSGLPMNRFIHEGAGFYWKNATAMPDRWVRWIVMRTNDDNDLTWKAVSKSPGFMFYQKVASYPFADVYELDSQYWGQLNTEPILGKQK